MIEPQRYTYADLIALPHHRLQADRSLTDGGYLTDDEPSPWLTDQDFTTPTPAAIARIRPFDIEHEPLPAHTARHRNRHRNLWAFLRRRPH